MAKVNIILIYLGTDVKKCKIDVRFVISDLKNIKGHIFPKIKFSKKIRTYMTVVPDPYYVCAVICGMRNQYGNGATN